MNKRGAMSRPAGMIIGGTLAFSALLIVVLVLLWHHTYFISITIDGKTASCQTHKGTVAEVLESVGYEVGEEDIVSPGLDEKVDSSTDIEIQRVTYKTIEVEEETAFKVIKKDDSSMNKGKSKVTRKGVKGKDKVTYKVRYLSGEETGREEVSRKTVKKPVAKKVLVGTRETIDGHAFVKKFTVKATAYTGGGTTASGTPAREGEIAVDPRVIPLGTRCYVEGYGLCTAEDTGGAVKGDYIDVYFNSLSRCRSWGVRYVTIYILE